MRLLAHELGHAVYRKPDDPMSNTEENENAIMKQFEKEERKAYGIGFVPYGFKMGPFGVWLMLPVVERKK